MRTSLAAICAAVVLAVAARPADAHQASATYARLEATADPAHVRYEILVAARDLFEALRLETDREATAAEIAAGKDRLAAYLVERVQFEADGERCRPSLASLEAVEQSQRFARVVLDVVCPAAIRDFALDYDLFYDLDPRHIGFVAVDGSTVRLTEPDDTRLVWHLGGEAPSGLLGFVESGVEHILYGPDHILFLISLLLMAVVTRAGPGHSQAVVRPPRDALVYAGAIVTSFTVAHSITLIGAALGWFELPGRLVESVIAASILFVAVDNAVRLDPPRRYVITFLFGLVHGLGFASMLRPLLPPEDVVLPLLAFNLGVELGQLGLVVVSLPLLYALVRATGAARYRRIVLPGAAVVLGAIALIWLLERALEIRILGL
ncbi:MAG TPA: HupE/UreJ family protein [Kofleriaceae bacterium]|nr:HupE/UreJ family protein [Kofleriaceae bacterium]